MTSSARNDGCKVAKFLEWLMSKRHVRNRYASASIGIAALALALMLAGAATAQVLPPGASQGQKLPPGTAPATTNPPAQTSPGATQPPAPGSARSAQCRKMAAELGMSGVRRTRYILNCSRR